MFSRRVAVIVASLAFLGFAVAEDKPDAKPETKKVDSPDFKNWAKFKTGTYVTVISTTDSGGAKTEQKMWYTLKTVGDDSLTVENEIAQAENVKFKAPPTSREFTKTVEATAKTEENVKAGKPQGVTAEGTETLKVGDKEYKCTWYKFRINTTSGPINGQLWLCDDVPGRMVKMKSESRAATTTAEVTEIVKK
jgi:hypothetical protein